MAKEKGESFSSSAGLMRYFDSEDDKGIKIRPKVIAGIAIAFTVLVLVLPVFFPVNRADGTENLCTPERGRPVPITPDDPVIGAPFKSCPRT